MSGSRAAGGPTSSAIALSLPRMQRSSCRTHPSPVAAAAVALSTGDHLDCQCGGLGSHSPSLARGGRGAMALEADRGADNLIRQVQRVLGKASPAAAFASLLYGRKGLDGLEQ